MRPHMSSLFESLSTGQVAVLLGILVGLMFGALAQQSRFCLRSACI
ncbi:MAG: hypothetical protein RLZZ409_1088, partial [Pseudomonadota bacterium]